MRHSTIIKTARVAAISAGLSFGLVGCANSAACPPTSEAQLGSYVEATFGSVRDDNVEAFLNGVGPDGVTINGQSLSRAELSQQAQNQAGVYCDLFACGGRKGALNALFRAAGDTQTQYDATNQVGLVLRAPNTNDEIMLTYKYAADRCAWDLVDITTP